MIEYLPLIMFAVVFLALMAGYPVALTLSGTALLFAFMGELAGVFAISDLGFIPGRLFGVLSNQTLIAIPLFIFMGVTLEKTRIAEALLGNLSLLLRRLKGGLAVAVIIVGMLMAASTGIVGATVVTMGLMSLPIMLKQGYKPSVATGTICATGTLGQIIPPSIALVLLGDVLSNAYQQAQLSMNIFNPKTVSVGDLFAGAIIPGLILVGLYLTYVIVYAHLRPEDMPGTSDHSPYNSQNTPTPTQILLDLLAPLLLILSVLGTILAGIATPTEAAGIGALGAILLGSSRKKISLSGISEISLSTLKTTSMVFFILIGASIFSLVFRGYGGDELIQGLFLDMPGGKWGAMLIVMIIIFLLGFILDFIEITFVVVPIVGPILLAMGIDPVWLGVMLAVNLQTSFLTPPFGFALFYLRGVTDSSIPTISIYRGVLPFIGLQLLLMVILVIWPALVSWLPNILHD
ncbi:MAG: TRAP transporter large permease subunit [Pseudomonadales bacterium]|nr:TRAP transporter large permease subunit [Pseudomonadales bacterium]